MDHYIEIKDNILDKTAKRYVEIYKITCIPTGMSYVGQAVSHILNHNKLRPYGMKGRLNCHISEAYSNKTKQCNYLNNVIKKYGKHAFELQLLHVADIDTGDYYENLFIFEHNTLFPNGYNLKTGGKTFKATDESKRNVSSGLVKYFQDKKLERFSDIQTLPLSNEEYLRPLNRFDSQYGWYVYIKKHKKADFGGVHIPLEKSKEMAIEFLEKLRCEINKRDTLLREVP
jgi:hypothetical protein